MIGGKNLWVTLDTGLAVSWVMSAACFMDGCKKVPLFGGMFIPQMPPVVAPVDLLEAGIFQIMSVIGIGGHSLISIAGKFVLGAPIHMGILDLGQVGHMGFNHTGKVGLAYWEETWPWDLQIIDPMLAMFDFMRCGSVFYPIPMVPVPIPKNFPMWPMPPFMPSSFVLEFSMFFADNGGCFFIDKAPSQYAKGAMMEVVPLPMPGVKFLLPSWTLMLTDIQVNGKSIRPCFIPALCRAVIRTGDFFISGPVWPALALLEETAVALTCDGLEDLPDVTFVLSGTPVTLTKEDYTVLGWSYDQV